MTDPIVPRTCQWKPSPPPRKSEMTQEEFVASFANKKIDTQKATKLLSKPDAIVDGKSLDLNQDGFISGEDETSRLFDKLCGGGRNTLDMVTGNFTSSTGKQVDRLQLLSQPTTPASPGDWGKGADAGAKAIQDNKQADLDKYSSTQHGIYYGDHSDYECKKDQTDPDGRAITPTNDAEKELKLKAKFPKDANETATKYDERIKGIRESMKPSSCVGWTMENIGAAYKAAGKGDRWKEIESSVIEKGSMGTDLALELQKDGWKAIYWNPDTKTPDASVRSSSEHQSSCGPSSQLPRFAGLQGCGGPTGFVVKGAVDVDPRRAGSPGGAQRQRAGRRM